MQKFQALCKGFGLEPQVIHDSDEDILSFTVDDIMVEGYGSFMCNWCFNLNGKFLRMEIFE